MNIETLVFPPTFLTFFVKEKLQLEQDKPNFLNSSFLF